MAGTHAWDALWRQPPPRTLPNSVRAVALRGIGRWRISLVLVSVVCLFLAAAFFPWSIGDDIRLDLGGTAGRGVVLESVYANRTLGDNIVVRKKLVFSVRFRFDDARAQGHEATCLFFGHLAPGTEVGVEYLPSNPNIARVQDGFFVPGGLWEVLWAIAFFAPPLLGMWNFRRWRWRRLALLVDGVAVPGVIEGAWRDQPHDLTRGWIAISYVAAGKPIRVSREVEGEDYRRACDIVEERQPLHILHAAQAPREHIVLDLMV